jgi:hypothetical protein
MANNNMYYEVTENPNIFPPSRLYAPQTQSGQSGQTVDLRRFQDRTQIQEQERRQAFLQYGNQQNLSNTNYASRQSREQLSQPRAVNGYADTPSISKQHFAEQQHATSDTNENTILQSDDVNNHSMIHMSYQNAFTPQPFFQLPQRNLINDPDPSFLSIDSHDRDRTKYPNTNEYTIPFITSETNGINNNRGNVPGKRYKNVIAIDLISAVIPNRANILDEIYLILQIDELDDNTYDASNPSLNRGFAKLFFTPVDGTTKWLRIDKDNSDPLHKVFYPKPKASLDRLTIRILKRDGTPFNFGTDNALPADVNPFLQNSWTFRITEKVVNADVVGQRNV